MAKQTVEALIEGGKATAAPPLGPALGPLGVNIGQIVAEINKKTSSFEGMKVPVKVVVDTETKGFEIEVGTPPASALVKKEAGIEKGAKNPKEEQVANILIEQVIKIAKMKENSLLGRDLKAKVKEIMGTCNGMGVFVEGVRARGAIKMVDEGKFDKEIAAEKTELTEEEKRKLEEEKKRLQEELEKRRAEFEAKAKEIIKEMEGEERGKIKARLEGEKIPKEIIDELLPIEAKVEVEEKKEVKEEEKK